MERSLLGTGSEKKPLPLPTFAESGQTKQEIKANANSCNCSDDGIKHGKLPFLSIIKAPEYPALGVQEKPELPPWLLLVKVFVCVALDVFTQHSVFRCSVLLAFYGKITRNFWRYFRCYPCFGFISSLFFSLPFFCIVAFCHLGTNSHLVDAIIILLQRLLVKFA